MYFNTHITYGIITYFIKRLCNLKKVIFKDTIFKIALIKTTISTDPKKYESKPKSTYTKKHKFTYTKKYKYQIRILPYFQKPRFLNVQEAFILLLFFLFFYE